MFTNIQDFIRTNKSFVLLAALLLADAAMLIAGLATKSKYFIETVHVSPVVYKLTSLGVAHVVAWTLGPPLWFFFETFVLNRHLLPGDDVLTSETPESKKLKLERLKLAQDQAAKVWAAVLAAILFLVPKA